MKMRTAVRRETTGARSFCVERAMNAICFFKKGCMVKKAESIRRYQSTKCIDQLLLLLVV